MKTVVGEKYLWSLPQYDASQALELAHAYNISVPIAQTLFNRGIKTKEQADSFLFTSFEKDVAHPARMKDAQKAVERIIRAIDTHERILIFGDYDVDGITATSLMLICLMPLGANVNFYLPHRVKDGYGLSKKVVSKAAASNYSLIITVDNGITAHEAVTCARDLSIDVIITDHHRPHEKIPPAYAVVNPAQEDCSYPFKKLAGVGVIFKVLSLLYEYKGLTLPSKAYELMLLGTVADVVPLIAENRYWVRHGLQLVNKQESYAFKVMKKNINNSKPSISSLDIGFNFAPQLNALGRLDDPRQGVSFLVGSDCNEIDRVGVVLHELNHARKSVERDILKQVVAEVEAGRIDLSRENIILAAGNNWSPGVIGLVASRLVGLYGRPTLLFHIDKNGLAKGSCRSIGAFNMFDALASCQDLLLTFGGHSQAAGLSLTIDNLPKLKEHLEKLLIEQVKPEELRQKLSIDAEISMGDVNKKLISDVQHLEPFGHENPQPLFLLKKVSLLEAPQLLKDEHVKCRLFADGVIKPLIFFNRPELYKKLQDQDTEPFDVAVKITENYWRDQVSIELLGEDLTGLKSISEGS